MEIAYLCDRPGLISELARAHVAAFGALLPDWTVPQAEEELRSHNQRQAVPTTWVAMDGERWLGSVSLLQNDHDDLRQYSPWLASLYVCPQARRDGVGQMLVSRCVEEAAGLGIPRLYLYCTDALTGYYRALGWRVHDRLLLGPLWLTVMAIDPVPPSVGAGSD